MIPEVTLHIGTGPQNKHPVPCFFKKYFTDIAKLCRWGGDMKMVWSVENDDPAWRCVAQIPRSVAPQVRTFLLFFIAFSQKGKRKRKG